MKQLKNNPVRLLAILLLALTLPHCKKDTISPSSPKVSPSQPVSPTSTTTLNPMDRVGTYRMFLASKNTETDTSVRIELSYRSYEYYSADTNQKIYLYSFENNVNPPSHWGVTRLSKNIIYENEGSTKSLGYIEVYGDTISYGLMECPDVTLGPNSWMRGDTMILNLAVLNTTPKQNIICKYLKE